MASFFWIGTAIGFIAGAIHAIHIIWEQHKLPGSHAVAKAAYRAVWALFLWSLFGAYLLALWIIGWILNLVFGRAGRHDRPA